jgi:predicted dithiol-disulfide oxidoreductase (DUF899 family)
MSLPDVVSQDEWIAARKALLAREKAATRERDALSAERRRLPMVRVEKEYAFDGRDGAATLLDLFDGRHQLILQHFMFAPDWEDGCSSCTAAIDELSAGLIAHLNVRDTSLAIVGRAPIAKILAYAQRRGWDYPFYSALGSDFNFDFHVTLDESVQPVEYNYRSAEEFAAAGVTLHEAGEPPAEQPGYSMFLRDGDTIYHTYSLFARGTEMLGGSYYWLDMTALGRQEDWEEPKDRAIRARSAMPNFAS